MSAGEPEVDPEVARWAARCYRRVAAGKPVHDLNARHLQMRLLDPAFANSEAGRRALRTIENLMAQVAA